MSDDTELMAALFVSDGGEIATHLEHAGEVQFFEEELYRCSWEHCGAIPSCVRSTVWYRVSVPESVAAGILRLIRERDDFRGGNDHWVKMHDREAAARTQAERERDEAREEAAELRKDLERMWRD